MLNPFIFGKVVSGDHFIDRETEVSAISQTLRSGQNIICYSPRRYGKTSMMMRVKDILSDQGQFVFFIDLFRVTSLEDLYNTYATSILSEIQSPLKALISTINGMLPAVNPKIVFKNPGAPTVEVSVPIPILSKSTTLRELFDSLEKFCAKKRKKGIVIFDEFQEIIAIEDGNIIEREMRSAFQHHTHVSYAFLGSKQHLLKTIFKNKNRPFYNFGRHFELDVITSDHWKKYIALHLGSRCPDSCTDHIIDICENHPYYTQMYCHYCWEHIQKHKGYFDKGMLDNILDEIVRRDSLFFSGLWDAVSMNERNLLKAIAADATSSIYEKRFILTHNLGTASSVQKAAEKLFHGDIIRKLPSGQVCLINPFFKYWIKQADISYGSSRDL
jgi:uncharacterized protein